MDGGGDALTSAAMVTMSVHTKYNGQESWHLDQNGTKQLNY